MPLAGFAVIGVIVVGGEVGQPTCSVADPCLPSRSASTFFGLLFGSMLVVYLHWRTAAWSAVGATVAFLVADFLDPTMPWWTYPVVFGYAALFWYLPGSARWVAGSAPASTVPVSDHRPVPRPTRVPVLGRHWLALIAVLAVGAIGMGWWGLAEQDRRDAQQQAARVMTGVVREHRDGFTAGVAFPDGSQANVDVLDADDYPVGSTMQFYVDGHGLVQPVSEPYDAAGWLTLAAIVAAFGTALAMRTVERNTALRRLFGEAQPVRAVGALEEEGNVLVLLPGPGPGRTTLVTVPAIHAEPPGDPEPDPTPKQAVLYGDPRPGHWCAVEVDGRIRLPRNPVRALKEIPVHPVTGEHSAEADEPPVDLSLLTEADRRASPGDLRFHRSHPLIGWARALASVVAVLAPAGLLITGPLDSLFLLDSLSLPGAFAIAAPLTALPLYHGWRRHLRAYLCWNAGGLVMVTAWRVHRLTWSAELRVDGTGSEVSVLDDENGYALTVTARQWMRFPPPASGERTAEQLRHALRHAREQAVRGGGTVPPPVAEVPRPPFAALLLCWAVLVPVVAAVLVHGL